MRVRHAGCVLPGTMSRPRALIVDDEKLIRWSLEQKLGEAGFEVVSAQTGEEALSRFEEERTDVVLLDIRLPGMNGIDVLTHLREREPSTPVVMVTACDSAELAIQAFKQGAADYVIKPFDLSELLVVVQRALEAGRLRREVSRFRQRQRERFAFDRIVGESAEMRAVVETCGKVAASDAGTVFLTGESGTGKDLVARAIHYASPRRDGQFVEINCAALPGPLLETELLGHELGAFTDAKAAKKGLVEVADGGTLFLDEVGDMAPGLQAKLLSVIEDRVVRRVGGVADFPVDIRVIAATNRDLDRAVGEGTFRADLYYRLNVVPLQIPPLRDRRGDIPLLAAHFLAHFSRLYKRKPARISAEAERLLTLHTWPGNVRELKNVIERAIILGDGDVVSAGSLPPEIRMRRGQNGGFRFRLPRSGVDLAGVEADFLRQALDASGGNQSRAARLLHLSRDALRYRMKKFGIEGEV